jgi:putative FmdB family regulatory protein
MPTYDYKCTKCGYAFEFFQRMTEEPLTKCPKCSSVVKRLIGNGAGIIFKGSGFYATDYKGKGKRPEAITCPGANKDNPACEDCNTKMEGEKCG